MNDENENSLETLNNRKSNELTIDEQIELFAEIISSHLCNEDNLNEKLSDKAD